MEDNKTEILDPDPSLEHRASDEWQISPREYNESMLGRATTLYTVNSDGTEARWMMLPDDNVFVGAKVPKMHPPS